MPRSLFSPASEARRVLCPGGRIVLVGQDWDAIMIASDDAALTRTSVHARANLLGMPRALRPPLQPPGTHNPASTTVAVLPLVTPSPGFIGSPERHD